MALVSTANLEFAGFRKKKKYTAYGNGPYGDGPYSKIPTKTEPITTLGFTSSLLYNTSYNRYLLLMAFSVRSVKYGPSFFRVFFSVFYSTG